MRIHMEGVSVYVFFFQVFASDSFRDSERENEMSGMLLLFCRVFITLRGPALIMHGYMAPQTSQCFTGEKISSTTR